MVASFILNWDRCGVDALRREKTRGTQTDRLGLSLTTFQPNGLDSDWHSDELTLVFYWQLGQIILLECPISALAMDCRPVGSLLICTARQFHG